MPQFTAIYAEVRSRSTGQPITDPAKLIAPTVDAFYWRPKRLGLSYDRRAYLPSAAQDSRSDHSSRRQRRGGVGGRNGGTSAMSGFVLLAARGLYADGSSTWSLPWRRCLLVRFVFFAGKKRLRGLEEAEALTGP